MADFASLHHHLSGNDIGCCPDSTIVAFITYCLVSVIDYELRLNRNSFDVARIIGVLLIVEVFLFDFFEPAKYSIL